MGQLQERLVWHPEAGAILDADRRYVMLRADVLMGLFTALPPALRDQALASLQASVRDHGGASARAYQAAGARAPGPLLQVMAQAAADLGWGVWHWRMADADAPVLQVENSPFATAAIGSDRPVCHAITGMLEAVSALVAGKASPYRETRCASMGAPCCEFEARRD
ncbi:V4R domain-containing protein [Achromobacter marplatensis]|uniref:V4R domain-containing protein n=1 Tax=Achromobacter marplatensis TaxID=470868 RepID=UPI0039F64DD1